MSLGIGKEHFSSIPVDYARMAITHPSTFTRLSPRNPQLLPDTRSPKHDSEGMDAAAQGLGLHCRHLGRVAGKNFSLRFRSKVDRPLHSYKEKYTRSVFASFLPAQLQHVFASMAALLQHAAFGGRLFFVVSGGLKRTTLCPMPRAALESKCHDNLFVWI